MVAMVAFGRGDDDGGKGLVDDDTDEELEELETRMGVGFPPGRSDDAKPLRLGVDPVEVSHRSLVYYSLVVMIDPVALLCHLPDVAYGFLGRAPTTERAAGWEADDGDSRV